MTRRRSLAVLVVLVATLLTTASKGTGSEAIAIGSLLKVTTSPWLWIRDSAAGSIIGAAPEGWVLVVTDGPVSGSLDGVPYVWWQVREAAHVDSALTGWIAQGLPDSDLVKEVNATNLHPQTIPAYVISAEDDLQESVRAARDVAGSRRWSSSSMTYCLGFVAEMLTGSQATGWPCPGDPGYACPNGGRQALEDAGSFYNAGTAWNPPAGALVFFSSDPLNGVDYGHIGLALGDGRIAHVRGSGEVGIDHVGEVLALSYIRSYDGWAYPPRGWLSESPDGCDLAGEWIGTTTYEWAAEAMGSDVPEAEPRNGVVTLELRLTQSGEGLSGEFRLTMEQGPGLWLPIPSSCFEMKGCGFDILLEFSEAGEVENILGSATIQLNARHMYSFSMRGRNLHGSATITIEAEVASSNPSQSGHALARITFGELSLTRTGD